MALIALKETLAGSGAELAEAAGIPGIAMRALHGFRIGKEFRFANLLGVIGRRNTISFELLLAGFRHPVCSPGGGQYQRDIDLFVAMRQQLHAYAHADHIHGRAAGVSGRDHNIHFIIVHFYITHDAQVQDREHRYFRVRYFFKQVPYLAGGYISYCMHFITIGHWDKHAGGIAFPPG